MTYSSVPADDMEQCEAVEDMDDAMVDEDTLLIPPVRVAGMPRGRA